MSKSVSVAGFDYEGIDKDTKQKLVYLAGQVKKNKEKLGLAGMDLGEAIHSAHELLAGDGRDGRFSAWVESETEIDIRMAYNCMYVWQRSQKLEIISSFPPTVAYMLAAPSVPDEAIKDFAKQLDKGTRPTVAAAKATLDRFREVAKPKPKKPPKPSDNGSAHSAPPPPPEPADDGPLNDEPEKELTFAERVKAENGKIESFCRNIVKCFEDGCPKLASVDHLGRYDSALAQIRAACSTLRTCKYHDEPCPACKGEGCKKCEKESDFGAVTVLTYRQLAG